MSTVEYGPYSEPSRERTPDAATAVAGRRWWREATAAAVLALANFAAFTLMLLHLVSRYQHEHNDVGRNVNFFLNSDLATPLIGWVSLLILLNGAVLCLPRSTRAVGAGLLGAFAVIAIPVVTWVVWTLATFSSG